VAVAVGTLQLPSVLMTALLVSVPLALADTFTL
jgi:hypothetical protein